MLTDARELTCHTRSHFSFIGFPQCADAPAGCVNPFPLFGTASPVCQRIAVVLPVEDGGGDAVWGWSCVLDLHKKRTRMDTKTKMNAFPSLLIEDRTLLGLFS